MEENYDYRIPGATWIAREFQRTGANVGATLLLLEGGLQDGSSEVQSRRAIGALGAVVEGTFRKHLLAEDYRPRDMIYFSILDDESPNVREWLMNRLSRQQAQISHALAFVVGSCQMR